jgi:hypothetical protein
MDKQSPYTSPIDCFCESSKCDSGREPGREGEIFCDSCVDKWLKIHLANRIRKILYSRNTESKLVITRSILQFLGLQVRFDKFSKMYCLDLYRHKFYGHRTHDVMAVNLGGKNIDEIDLKALALNGSNDACLLARYIQGIHVSTAHLTWGANHTSTNVIWDINNANNNKHALFLIMRFLKTNVYFGPRQIIWDQYVGGSKSGPMLQADT